MPVVIAGDATTAPYRRSGKRWFSARNSGFPAPAGVNQLILRNRSPYWVAIDFFNFTNVSGVNITYQAGVLREALGQTGDQPVFSTEWVPIPGQILDFLSPRLANRNAAAVVLNAAELLLTSIIKGTDEDRPWYDLDLWLPPVSPADVAAGVATSFLIEAAGAVSFTCSFSGRIVDDLPPVQQSG